MPQVEGSPSRQNLNRHNAEGTTDAVGFGQGMGTLACVGQAAEQDLRLVGRCIAEQGQWLGAHHVCVKLDEFVAAVFNHEEQRLAALDAVSEGDGERMEVAPNPADVLGNILDFVEGDGCKRQYDRYMRSDSVVPGRKLLSQVLDLRLAVQLREGYDAVLGRLHAVIVAISKSFGNRGIDGSLPR
jgi:hypothetical protein